MVALQCEKRRNAGATLRTIAANQTGSLIVQVVRTIFSSASGFTVLILKDVKNGREFKGVSRIPLNEGEVLRVEGSWRIHEKYGEEFDIFGVGPPEAGDADSAKKILCFVKGIGPSLASRIVKRFGENTIRIMDEEPERLLEVDGIGPRNIEVIKRSWKEKRSAVSVLSKLCSMGLSASAAGKAYFRWKEKAPELVKKNPYILTELHGVGFKKADEIALSMGISPESRERVEAGVLYVLAEAALKEGHCFLPEKEVLSRLSSINVPGRLDEVLPDLEERKKVVREKMGIYPFWTYRAERKAEENLKRIMLEGGGNEKASFPPAELSDEQKKAFELALSHPVSVITGLPGTGKTTTLRAVARALSPYERVYLAAPTGKAARRLSEVVGIEAVTIHRLLQFTPGPDGWFFVKNENNPLPEGTVIVDETSMVDVLLFSALLSAVSSGSRVVLVGDYNQLPSVGPGNVLKDLVSSSVIPRADLRNIHRQAENSPIVRLSHMVHKGIPPSWRSENGVYMVREENPAEARSVVVRAARYFVEKLGRDGVQVLSPMRRGNLGTVELNRVLQDALNPEGEKIPGTDFRVRDRVMQVVNDYDKGIFNGEVGFIEEFDREDEVVRVRYDDRVVEYFPFELDEITLAYAMTIHKSQGSEFDCVIVPVHTQHYIMLRRQLIYTAFTRAKRFLVVVGMPKALSIAVKKAGEVERFTGLLKS